MSTYEANRYNFTGANVTGIPTSAITSGTFADARLSSSSITQHVDLSNLNASNLTSGTVPNARYGTPTFSAANLTDISAMPIAPTTGTWTPSFSHGSWANITGKDQKFGRIVFSHATIVIKDNSTVWHMPSNSSSEQSWRMTQYYNTNQKGAMKSTSFRGFDSGTTDKNWGFITFHYVSAS